MSVPDSSGAAALQVIPDMVAEAQALKEAAGDSVTDPVAAWLTPHT